MQPRNHDTRRLEHARELRQDANVPEQLLWEALRSRRFKGFKFRRQHAIGPYVADFYCAAASLIVELDGETHRDKADNDARRQAALERQELFVLRCANHEFYENFEGLLEKIWLVCCERTGTKPTLSFEKELRRGVVRGLPLTPGPSPQRGRGE